MYVAGYPGFTWVDRFVGYTGVIKEVHTYVWQGPAINVLVRWDGPMTGQEREFALEVLELR